jgi:acetyl-CoA synthetase
MTIPKKDRDALWETVAKCLPWFKQWDKVLEWNEPIANWFVGGTLNASYACVDVNAKINPTHKAIEWCNEHGKSLTLTYEELYKSVNKCAAILSFLGVKKGDIVVIYMPMIPQAIVSMLAVARLGAIHSVVFSGFSANALKDRITDAQATYIITCDSALYRGKKISIKDNVDIALKGINNIKKVLVLQRETTLQITLEPERDILWHEISHKVPDEIPPCEVESSHPLFILYTSGTTGKPKGIVHSTGGYLTYVYATIDWAFSIKKDSIYWCTADIGWITGHSYVTYGPLLHGATIVLYEGAPDYPTPDRWWGIIQKYKVSIFYTSPTALRMFIKYGEGWISRYDLSSLKVLGSVGEPINPEVWQWY